MTKPFRHGLVLGKFYPLHAGQSNLIRTALRQCDEVTAQLLVNSAETIPLETRLAWLQEGHPTANIGAEIDDAEVDFDSPTAWEFDLVVDRQMQMKQEALRRVPKRPLICDTDVLATALWHERYVGEPAERILERAAAHQPALYILTGDDIPFVQDGLRDGERIRHQMHERFREVLAAQPTPSVEVRGNFPARAAAARTAVERATKKTVDYCS